MKSNLQASPLSQLAESYGIQLGYVDMEGKHHDASPEVVIELLKVLGARVEGMDDLENALTERRREHWSRGLEPVTAIDRTERSIALRLPAHLAEATFDFRIEKEGTGAEEWRADLSKIPVEEEQGIAGERHVLKRLRVPKGMPWGYHRLRASHRGKDWDSLLIAAPLEAYGLPEGEKIWGTFLPIYALRGEGWGVGDFSDMGRLIEWTYAQGGKIVGTLPFLAAFLDRHFDPSPYSPASRLFWNEIFIDVDRAAEFAFCPPADEMTGAAGFYQGVEKAIAVFEHCPAFVEMTGADWFNREMAKLNAAPLVDYRNAAVLKRAVLDKLARSFFSGPAERRTEFDRFLQMRPEVRDYARFRAVCERREETWREWPAKLREGKIGEEDFDAANENYHLFVQWIAEEQIHSLAAKAGNGGLGLYLDFPIGVNSNGYDMWRERDAFAIGASAGAPPDPFFSKGQNWGFSPLHPDRCREQSYRYLIACLRHQFRHAGVIRIDHIMGLHRLYFIPEGADARDGVYVHYPADELYSILALESHRNKTAIIGEDLGTVPEYVRAEMERREIARMYVLPFEVEPIPSRAIHEIPSDTMASLNTHDMPTFKSFWEGADIAERIDLGLLTREEAEKESTQREDLRSAMKSFLRGKHFLTDGEDDVFAILRACLNYLAESPASCLLVNIEDLLLETKPQNTPGTGLGTRPNWQRKAKFKMDEFSTMPQVLDALREVNLRRRKA